MLPPLVPRVCSAPFALDVGEFSVKLRKKMNGQSRPVCAVGNVDADFDENLDGEEQEREGEPLC